MEQPRVGRGWSKGWRSVAAALFCMLLLRTRLCITALFHMLSTLLCMLCSLAVCGALWWLPNLSCWMNALLFLC